jgi:autotransporter-associated beta strand protein
MKKISSIIITALMLTAGVSQAANIWDGGGADGNWTTVGNWDNNLNPAAYAAVTFNTAGAGQTNTFLGGGRFLNQLIFNANANNNIGIELATTAGGTGAANLYLYGTDAGGAPKITVDSGAAANIRIFGGPSASVVGLGVRAGNTASGDLTIDHNGSGNLSIEKGITGAGYSVTKTGTGTLTLANSGNASTYNNFTLNDGRVRIGGTQVATALGTNIVTLNGGTLSSDSTTALTNSQALVFGGNVTLGHTNDNGELTLNGTADLGGATRTITADSAVTLGGVIGNGGLTKAGGSTLTLSGTNTYSGVTTVSDGTLTLADNAGMTFVIGANGVNNKLTGKGTAALAGDFYFDLTSAGTTTGDSWTIANVSNQTFDATFTVNGFTAAGGGKWIKIINGTSYEFSQSTSVLRVNVGSETKISLVIIQ